MGKTLNAYNALKRKDKTKVYILNLGFFYSIINEDAELLSPLLNLTVVEAGKNLKKCGFPKSEINKYLSILNKNNIPYSIIENLDEINVDKEYMKNLEIKKIIDEIESIDLLETSPKDSFNILCNFQTRIKKVQGI